MSETAEKILKFAELYAEAGTKEYQREYMAKRYHDTRQKIYDKLGNQCAACGTTEGPFHLDHINKKKKTMRASDLHSVNDGRFEKEVKNLQMLCVPCHKKKTNEAWDYAVNKPQHGTVWMYRKYNCRCPACVKAYKDRNKKE